jgi:putative SOS response-associated peptidase YedK
MVLTRSASEIAAAFEAEGVLELLPRYNVAPSQAIVAVRIEADGVRHLTELRWGLIPGWAKDRAIGNRLINARSETVAEKPSFRAALKRRRCVVPADGFYEWQGKAPARPHFFSAADGGLLAIAGLWEEWTDKATGELIESCTLLTTEANQLVRPIHHRMPVLLERDDLGRWLDTSKNDAESVRGLMVPSSPDRLVATEVSTLVNDPRNEDPRCVEAI